MRYLRLPRLALLPLLAAATACSVAGGEPSVSAVDADEQDLTLFRPPVATYIANLSIAPRASSVSVAFSTATEVTTTVSITTVGTPRMNVGSTSDAAPSSLHALDVGGLSPCTTYKYRVDTPYGSASGSFTTGAVEVERIEVTRVSATWGRVYVRTNGPGSVNLRMTQAQALDAPPTWTVTMSNPGALDHNYYFGINGPKYVAEAQASVCGGWTPLWASLDAWPRDYGDSFSPAPTGLDYPRDRNIDYYHHIQGVAHGADSWFISNQYGIHKIAFGADLNTEVAHPSVRIPTDAMYAAGESDHVGDVDFRDGILYVPLEHKEGMDAPPKVLFYDESLGYLGYTILSSGATNEIPWVALNPIDGRLYTSTFEVSGLPGCEIRAYDVVRDGAGRPIALRHDPSHDVVLRDKSGKAIRLHGVQGGVFSPMGHLYLSVDAEDDAAFGGIQAFEWPSGTQRMTIPIDYQKKLPGNLSTFEEIEGLDLWDAPPGVAPGISGQLHVMMGKWTNRSLWFKHFALGTDAGRALL